MVALVIVLVSGWLLASIIGTWAYFAAKVEDNIVPFANVQNETYNFLSEQRQAKLKSQARIRTTGQMGTVY